LESSADPIHLLDHQRGLVQEILGENNMECVKVKNRKINIIFC